jgi:very-short-patch-repair endonuclease
LDAPVQVTVPSSCHPIDAGFIVHRSVVRNPDRLYEIDGIPVTTPARTLTDVARCLPLDILEETLDTALRKGLLSEADRRLLAAHTLLGPMLEERLTDGGVAGSQRETCLRQVLRAAGLPLPVAQYEVHHDGRFIARVDFAYPQERIAIEYDGYETHSSRRAFERDRRRWQKLQAAGYAVQPFTRDDLKRPMHLTSSLYGLLRDRSHPDVAD